MNESAYPTAVVIRCLTEGDVIHIDPDKGIVVKAWRWRIGCVGVISLIVTEDADGRCVCTADHLAPAESVMSDLGDVATFLLSSFAVDPQTALTYQWAALKVVADTAMCMLWAWLARHAEPLTGHVWEYQEWLSEQVITCPRHALPVGVRGGTEDLRRPLPLQPF